MNPTATVEGVLLQDAFEDKLVVLLNDVYVPIPNVKAAQRNKCRPSLLLKSAYEHPASTKFLIVGGTTEPVRHLSPIASAINTKDIQNKSYPNIKTSREHVLLRLAHQRTNGFELDREKPLSFDVCVKMKAFSQPTSTTILQEMKKRAKKTARWFNKSDPLRPYEVTWVPLVESVLAKEGWLSTWEIGSLHVRVGPPRTQSAFSFVEEPEACAATGRLVEPEIIQSRSMMYALLHAASFPAMMSCYCRKLSESANYSDAVLGCEEVLAVIKDCLVGDFIMDITNYDHGRLDVKEVLKRSLTLHRLRYCESLNALLDRSATDEVLQKMLKKHLSTLVGAMKCAARTKDLRPWWKPFSRKFRSGRHMVQALDELEEYWGLVLDAEAIIAEKRRLRDIVKATIKERKKSKFAMVSIRGRSRATMAGLHSPRNSETYQNSFRTARVHGEPDVLAGDSLKIKKYLPRTLDPSESTIELFESDAAESYRKKIWDTVAEEYALYVRIEDV